MKDIYEPAEDSFFLSEFVKREVKKSKPKKILDMGSGSGIQAKTCIDSGADSKNLTLVDINERAIRELKKKFPKSRIIHSDMFQNLNKEKFDLIIFNPPYLPKNKYDKEKDTTGGNKGGEIINRFLNQIKKYLSKNGKVLLLTSSFTKGIKWPCSDLITRRLLGKKKLFFEELYVWGLSFNVSPANFLFY
ncbi:hypothetical protein DRN69_01100 [Candidatus Pacearchaeota archaeon]|nr:MAG: hypothetical protein DRN69_01100 [Candidatus Pacearchaeota archaeon]